MALPLFLIVLPVKVQFSKVARPPFSITISLEKVQFLKVMFAPAGMVSLSLLSLKLIERTSVVEPAAKVRVCVVWRMLPISRTFSTPGLVKKSSCQPMICVTCAGIVAVPVATQLVLTLMTVASPSELAI